MGTPNSQALAILKFWRDVELLNLPTAPDPRRSSARIREIENRPEESLPWVGHELPPTNTVVHNYTVYLGVVDKVEMIEAIVDAAAPGRPLDAFETERMSGNTWLAAFTLDEIGVPITGTYVRASFGIAHENICRRQSLEAIAERLEQARRDFEAKNVPSDHEDRSLWAFDMGDLADAVEEAKSPLGTAGDRLHFRVLVKTIVRPLYKNKATSTEPDVEFLNSFFLNDLDAIISCAHRGRPLGPALDAYLQARAPDGDRLDVLEAAAMAPLLAASRLPSGRWPSSPKHPLYLAQQAAVFESLAQLSNGAGLVAINGPPGTGKTTLLFDVIADIVVQRAKRLSDLTSSTSIFNEKKTIGGLACYPLSEKVAQVDGVVVTSNNNTAVENITRELPSRAKIASCEFEAPTYFAEVAQNIFDQCKIEETAWGLVAAALGNAKNRAAFVDGFFRSQSSEQGLPRSNMKSLLEEVIRSGRDCEPQWEKAKQDFRALLNRVEKERANAVVVEAAIAREAENERLRASHEKLLADVEHRLIRLEEFHVTAQHADTRTLSSLSQTIRRAELDKESHSHALNASESRLLVASRTNAPPFWERWAHVVGIETNRNKAWRDRVTLARIAHADAADAVGASLNELNRLIAALEDERLRSETDCARRLAARAAQAAARQVIQSTLDELNTDQMQLRTTIDDARHQAMTLPDAEFWRRPAAERHMKSVWVTPKLDRLRSELFIAALRLHEATIRAGAPRFIANFRLVSAMLTRETKEPIDPAHKHLIWQMLFFCVPVVSTTLASFDRLFDGLESQSIGWVLVDEAGQATPQSIAGALWRARRAIVIGDPLQIEPVMTVPSPLIKRLQDDRNLGEIWSPVTQSAQTVSDRTMRLGALVPSSDGGEAVWTGLPLRVHRRCGSPMFDIANRIAYAGQMVQAAAQADTLNCVLGNSVWRDVQGTKGTGQLIDSEMAALGELFIHINDDWPYVQGSLKPARIYVISPFRTVAIACAGVAAGFHAHKGNVECGTVHAFQGKEADIVVLVLGSAPGDQGRGSRQWASSKPNLLNVALTRAKHRIYVIGDRENWRRHPGFSDLANTLPVRRIS